MKESMRLSVAGMTCAACVASIEKALKKVEGVESASVNLVTREATALGSPPGGIQALIDAVQGAGYTARSMDSNPSGSQDGSSLDESRAWLVRLVPSAIVTAVLLAAMFGVPGVSQSTGHWIQLVLCIPVYFWAGFPFHRIALAGVRRGSTDMNTLISLGTSAAFWFSTASTAAPNWFQDRGIDPVVYFDGTAVIITLILMGRWLEAKARHRAAAEVRGLTRLLPPKVTLVTENGDAEIALEAVKAGQRLRVVPGAAVPVDGTIREGRSTVDESMVTGESEPAAKQPGDRVLGGTMNHDGSFIMEAQGVGSDMMLSKIHSMVLEAQGAKAPIQRLADRAAAVFVPSVLVIALLTLVSWWWWDRDMSMALLSFVSVLIVACPCALGLATPAAIMVGTGAAARRGILFKGGDVLEAMGRVNTVVFDKTGTLTQGRAVLDQPLNPEALALAAAVEAHSEHPLAKAAVRAAREASLAVPASQAFQAYRGKGVQALVDGVNVRIGTAAWLNANGVDTAVWEPKAAAAAERGRTPILVARGKEVVGLLTAGDSLRPEAESAVAQVRELGLELHLASGDRRRIAEALGREVGITQVHAEMLPEDKLNLLQELRASGRVVAMVGDGVNDAPALAAADVGVAMGSGTEAALETAPVVLVSPNLELLPRAITISRKTLGAVRQNLIWAFGYNILAIPIAAGALCPLLGWTLNPMIAAGAMALSSVSVLLNSLRLRRSL